MWYLFAAELALSNTTGSLVTVTFLSSSHNLYRPYSLSLDYGGETSFLVSYLCLHKRSLAWAEFLRCMGQMEMVKIRMVSCGCVHHPSPWGVRKSLYFPSNAWALLICVQCIFFSWGVRSRFYWWRFPSDWFDLPGVPLYFLFCCLLTQASFFPGKNFTNSVLFRVWYFLFLWRFALLVRCWGERIRLLV